MVDFEGLIEHLAERKGDFGLLSMQAGSSLDRLAKRFPDRLVRLFSAEHGFFGSVGAGDKTGDAIHPVYELPIFSLYGDTRKPTPKMLEGLDRLVIDLCDIGVRCYTYLATLKLAMEACAENNVAVTVVDRPIPLGGVVDGPVLKPGLESFVGPIQVPLCHGMTPGECAVWIARNHLKDVDLEVIQLKDWNHFSRMPWPNFIPPSPAIRSWDCAALYPMMVFSEAFPALDCDRGGALAFRVVGAPWMDACTIYNEVARRLRACGIDTRPYTYVPTTGKYAGEPIAGLLFTVAHPQSFYPVTAGILLAHAIMSRYPEAMKNEWRPEWLDKLYGDTAVREALSKPSPGDLFQSWIEDQEAYRETRIDLYS